MGLRAAQRGVLLLGQVPAGVCTGPEAATSPNLLGWAAEQGEAAVGLQHLGAERSPMAELWGHHPARACSQGLSGWLLEWGQAACPRAAHRGAVPSCPGTPQRLRRPRGLRVTKQFRSALPGSRALPAAPGAGREAPRERGKGAGVSRELCPSHTRVCPVLGTPRFARGPWGVHSTAGGSRGRVGAKLLGGRGLTARARGGAAASSGVPAVPVSGSLCPLPASVARCPRGSRRAEGSRSPPGCRAPGAGCGAPPAPGRVPYQERCF